MPAVCTNAAWSAPSAAGTGADAHFAADADGTFAWDVSSATIAATPIDFADGFENYPLGAEAKAGETGPWTGRGEIVSSAVDDAAARPMAKDPHEKAMRVGPSVACSFPCTTNGADTVEIMTTVRRRRPDEYQDVDDEALFAVSCDDTGIMHLYCRLESGERAWIPLSAKTWRNGDWVRIAMRTASGADGATFVSVWLDGEPCETPEGFHSPFSARHPGVWHRALRDSSRIAELEVNGDVDIDDAIKSADGYDPEIPPGVESVGGVRVDYLRRANAGLDPNAPVRQSPLRAMGYTYADLFTAGLDADSAVPFMIEDVRLRADGRLELVFNGLRDDLDSAARANLYTVLQMDEPDGAGTPVPGSVALDPEHGKTVWTSSGAVAAERASAYFRCVLDAAAAQ